MDLKIQCIYTQTRATLPSTVPSSISSWPPPTPSQVPKSRTRTPHLLDPIPNPAPFPSQSLHHHRSSPRPLRPSQRHIIVAARPLPPSQRCSPSSPSSVARLPVLALQARSTPALPASLAASHPLTLLAPPLDSNRWRLLPLLVRAASRHAKVPQIWPHEASSSGRTEPGC